MAAASFFCLNKWQKKIQRTARPRQGCAKKTST